MQDRAFTYSEAVEFLYPSLCEAIGIEIYVSRYLYAHFLQPSHLSLSKKKLYFYCSGIFTSMRQNLI